MQKTKVNHPQYSALSCATVSAGQQDIGKIQIEFGAIASMVRRIACEIEGVTRISGNSVVDNIAEFVGSKKIKDRAIVIKASGDVITIEISLNVGYGVSLPEVAADVQQSVTGQVEELTGLKVRQVDIIIQEMEEPVNDMTE